MSSLLNRLQILRLTRKKKTRLRPKMKFAPLNTEAIYRNPKLERRIPVIMSLTRSDSQGRQYYQHQFGSWKCLRTPEDYKHLNQLIDSRC